MKHLILTATQWDIAVSQMGQLTHKKVVLGLAQGFAAEQGVEFSVALEPWSSMLPILPWHIIQSTGLIPSTLLSVYEASAITDYTARCEWRRMQNQRALPHPLHKGSLTFMLSCHLPSWSMWAAGSCLKCHYQDRSLLSCQQAFPTTFGIVDSLKWASAPSSTHLGGAVIWGNYFWNMLSAFSTLTFTKFSTLWEFMVIVKSDET